MPSAPRSILTCKISSVLSIPATDEHHTALFLLLSSSSLNSLSSLSLIFTRRSPPIEDAAPSRAPSMTPTPCRPGPPPCCPSSSFKPTTAVASSPFLRRGEVLMMPQLCPCRTMDKHTHPAWTRATPPEACCSSWPISSDRAAYVSAKDCPRRAYIA